jgi:hypothetical protein
MMIHCLKHCKQSLLTKASEVAGRKGTELPATPGEACLRVHEASYMGTTLYVAHVGTVLADPRVGIVDAHQRVF